MKCRSASYSDMRETSASLLGIPEKFEQPVSQGEDSSEVAIIGAGPYALSLAAHLCSLGVSHRIFGIPMQTWTEEMPKGMFLKSDGFASDLYDPDKHLTLKIYHQEQGLTYADQGSPISLKIFCAYGMEFQRRLVPNLEKNLVTHLRATDNGFILQLDDGKVLHAGKVVLAVGISHFKHVPEWIRDLPLAYWSHSSTCTDPSRFAGRDVAVIGAGASALDLVALLHAAGARVQLIARKPSVEFHTAPSKTPRTLWQRLRNPKSGLGPSLRSFLYSEAPQLFYYLPLLTRMRIARTYLGPSGGWFIRDQVVGKIDMALGQNIRRARVQGGRVALSLIDIHGEKREISIDHVISATGYKIDMGCIPFMDDGLLRQLRMIDRVPGLSPHFETSVPGLHVIGPAAVNSFGPVMRFAFGARFAARRLSTFLARTRAARPSSRPAVLSPAEIPRAQQPAIRGMAPATIRMRSVSRRQSR